jgi:peptidylprolyl isomerase
LAVSTAAAVAADSEPPPQEAPADAVRSSSGLASQVLREGSGESPDANVWVMMFYTGWSPAGFKFDSNVGGQPVQVSLEKVSPGWQEGLRLMAVGEKRRLWIPARLAPPTPNAGPAGDVIFDVELLAVFRVPSPPPGLLQPPADAGRTAFGAFTKVLDKGEGAQAVTGVGVLVHYTVWTEDGKVLDSTVPRQRPTLFMWDKVMPAFADALQQMTVGEKRLIWIPAAVAGGQWPGSPRGALTFEAQVVQIMEKDIFAPKPTDAQGGSPHSG